MAKGEKVPDEIIKQLKIWHTNAGILRNIHIILGVTTITSSVTVAARLVDVRVSPRFMRHVR